MTIKRQIRTRLLKALRRIGLLCKKTATPKHRIRISKTVFPDGTTEEHGIITVSYTHLTLPTKRIV